MGFFFSTSKPFNFYISRLFYRIIIPSIIIMAIITQLAPWIANKTTFTQCLRTLNTESFIILGKILTSFYAAQPILPGVSLFGPVWFIFDMILCYLTFPILKLICADNEAARSAKKYILWMGLFLFVFRSSLDVCFPDNQFVTRSLLRVTPLKHAYWLWVILLGHQLGVYFKNLQTTRPAGPILLSSSLLVYIGCASIIFWLTLNFSINDKGIVTGRFFNRAFILSVLSYTALFIFL